jgi:two-component system cell cycle response regulator/two-component system cell cycle response regulator DivK
MANSTILVVEDHPLNRELVVDILEAAGYTMLQAEDGIGLLEQVKAERPDLIILDLQLPAVDGLTLARQLKADPATKSIPILAISTHAVPQVQAQARAAGCAGFLTKPLDTQEFVLTIARALGQ